MGDSGFGVRLNLVTSRINAQSCVVLIFVRIIWTVSIPEARQPVRRLRLQSCVLRFLVLARSTQLKFQGLFFVNEGMLLKSLFEDSKIPCRRMHHDSSALCANISLSIWKWCRRSCSLEAILSKYPDHPWRKEASHLNPMLGTYDLLQVYKFGEHYLNFMLFIDPNTSNFFSSQAIEVQNPPAL